MAASDRSKTPATVSLHSIRALAVRFADALEARNLAAIAECYAPEFRVWHNFDRLEKTRSESLAMLEAGFEHSAARHYVERRIHVFSGGYVQQHVIVNRRKDGNVVRTPAAIVCDVKDGKIARIDEYIDIFALKAFRS